jgi:hypothetical protein
MRESNDQIRTLDQHSSDSGDEQKQRRINADGLMGVKADSEPGSLPGNGGAFRVPPQNQTEDYEQAENEAGDLNNHGANLGGLGR